MDVVLSSISFEVTLHTLPSLMSPDDITQDECLPFSPRLSKTDSKTTPEDNALACGVRLATAYAREVCTPAAPETREIAGHDL